ncbi:LysR family transcriptional regulator [Frigidibacter sp. MR17.24]|uniref:LysR family transcriptional regulator n=1 Tax=Frigidibacter sp. MR17.24 TaxID=3127345 RepID=UPI0030130A9F
MPNSAPSFDDLSVFLAVVRRGGFRDAARDLGLSPSTVSDTITRLEARLGARLLTRTTRSVAPTEVGRDLAARLAPLLAETAAAVDAAMSRGGEVRGRLTLNVPGAVMVDILPPLIDGFLARHPEVRVEIMVEDRMVDAVAAGCDAGIRYGEALAQDMIAVPIGPRVQQSALAAAPGYLARRGTPAHPTDLLSHDCLMVRFTSGAMARWEFERAGEVVRVDPEPRLTVGVAAPMAVIEHAAAGLGLCCMFRNWLEPRFASGALVPVLRDWWPSYDGPRLYYANRRFLPPPLRAFIDHVRAAGG